MGSMGGVEEARHKDNTGTRTRIDRTGETEREGGEKSAGHARCDTPPLAPAGARSRSL